MKKKIVALALTVVLISMFFTGCSLFSTNEDRDYHQVVANVSYKTNDGSTLTAEVFKGEVNTQVNVYAAYFMQNGWTADEIVEYCFNSVARQKLLLLYAQEYVYNNKLVPQDFAYDSLGAWNDFKNKDRNNMLAAYRAFVTIDELRHCIELVNKSLDEQWQSLIEENEKEADKNNGETSSGEEDEDKVDDKDLLAAREKKESANSEEEDDEYELNESIKTEENVVNYFADLYELNMDASSIENAYFTKYVNTIIRNESDDEAKKIKRTALKTLEDRMKDQFVDYEYFLVQQIQSYIVEKYTDHIGETEKIIQEVNDDFDARYKRLVDSAIESYKDSSAYNTAVGNKTFAYAAPSKDYLQVKSLLLSFSDAQKSAITNLANLNSHSEDFIKVLREIFATGVVPAEYEDMQFEVFARLGIEVNVSNPDYDADEDELKDAYTDASIKDKENVYANPSVNYMTVLAAMANDIKAKTDRALNWANDNNMSDIEKYLIKQNAAQEAFNDWLNLSNDDSGTFKNDVYAVTPEGEETSYVEEYTVLARALATAGVGATAIKDYSKDNAETGTVVYAGTTEILKAGNGAYTIYKQNMKSSVGKGKDELEANVFTLVTESGAELSFIVNEFGIHVVMVASKPVDETLGSISEQVEKVTEDNKEVDKTFYIKGTDYISEYSVKFEYEKDEDDNDIKTQIKNIVVEKSTIEEALKKLLNEELSSDVTRLQQLNLFGDETQITKVDKVYKQVVSELKDRL